MLFDGGTPDTWPVLRARLLALDAAEREIDIAVISHIDSDHIGGMLPLLGDSDLGVRFGDVWFNGLAQLPEQENGTSRSVAEGESVVRLLSGAGEMRLPWNRAFDGRAAMTAGDGRIRRLQRQTGPELTLLSPTPRRLRALRNLWATELGRMRRGEPAEPAPGPQAPARLEDLETLAATPTARDASIANGSSIALLLEHQGVRCLLAADAWASVLGAALTAAINDRGGERLELDLFKLSHHGSKGNVTSKLLGLVPARQYVVSTNGERFHHPDDVALARVVTSAPAGATICFNYASASAERWSHPDLRKRYEFQVVCPAKSDGFGARLELDSRSA